MSFRPDSSLFPAALIALCLGAHILPAQEIAPAAPEAKTTREITVICWNIEWFPGRKRDADASSMAAHMALVRNELRRLDPDVFLAQEVRDWQSFATLSDALPGLRPAVVSAFTAEDTGEYWNQQLAIASKLPVLAAWSERWKAGVEMQPRRGFSAAAIQLDGGRLLLVYSVHLKSNRSGSEEEAQLNYRTRDESARQFLDHVSHMEKIVFPGRIAGVLVGGDFNTNADGQFGDRVVEMLIAGGFHHTWAGIPKERRLTWRGNQFFSATTFDHIFTKGLGEPVAELVETAEASSDHQAIRLRFTPPR